MVIGVCQKEMGRDRLSLMTGTMTGRRQTPTEKRSIRTLPGSTGGKNASLSKLWEAQFEIHRKEKSCRICTPFTEMGSATASSSAKNRQRTCCCTAFSRAPRCAQPLRPILWRRRRAGNRPNTRSGCKTTARRMDSTLDLRIILLFTTIPAGFLEAKRSAPAPRMMAHACAASWRGHPGSLSALPLEPTEFMHAQITRTSRIGSTTLPKPTRGARTLMAEPTRRTSHAGCAALQI